MRWIFGIAVLSFLLYLGGNYAPGFFQFFPHGFSGQNPYEPVPMPGIAEADPARERFVVECDGSAFNAVRGCVVFDKKTRIEYSIVITNNGVAVLDRLSEGR